MSETAKAPDIEVVVSDSAERVEGKDVTLWFDAKRCIHARFCVTNAPETFVANTEGDWLFPDNTDAAHLLHVAQQCPSGAIQIKRKTAGLDEIAPQVNTARVLENGPLAVHAEIILDGHIDSTRRALCRCGKSASKPYCDGSHLAKTDDAAPFIATGEPLTRDMTMLSLRGGPLQIDAKPNGPLKFTGPVEIISGTGRGVERTTGCFLCRCGASANKPFCDGSHKRIGFKTDTPGSN